MNIISILFQEAAIGDYLFLIMIVVVSIIQAITQNNKKKALQGLSQENKSRNKGQTTELQEYIPETMSGYEPPVDSIFDSVEKTPGLEIDKDIYDWDDDFAEVAKAEKEEHEVIAGSINPEGKLHQNSEDQFKVDNVPKPVAANPKLRSIPGIRSGFSLRKAVIYSEILNNKYT